MLLEEEERTETTPKTQRPITARRRIGAWEGASGCAALRRAAPPHSPSALLAMGLVTYARYVMRHCVFEHLL
jgi:hypothetical protein